MRRYHPRRRRSPGYTYRPYGGRRCLTWRQGLLTVLLALLALFAALQIYIGVHARDTLIGEPEVMVVFGCKVDPEGPSVMLQDRLDSALSYLQDHPDMTVVVTGGQGDDEPVSEAQAMYDYLTGAGVAGAQILREDQSRNTWQNVNYTLSLLEMEGYEGTEDVLLVSSGFHLARIELLWNRAREQTVGSKLDNEAYISTLAAPVSYLPGRVQMFFREPMALVKSFLLDR